MKSVVVEGTGEGRMEGTGDWVVKGTSEQVDGGH